METACRAVSVKEGASHVWGQRGAESLRTGARRMQRGRAGQSKDSTGPQPKGGQGGLDGVSS